MRLTREGKKFLIAAALISLAAMNTGNNLIYLILSMMLSMMAVAAIALRLNLRGLLLDASSAQQIFVNSPTEISISVENKKSLLPSFSLRPRLPGGIEGEGLIPYVAPSSSATGEVRAVFPKRGLYSLEGFALESGFPFIFLKKSVKIPLKREFIVFPEIREIGPLPGASGRGDAQSPRPGDSEDMLYLREFRHGDDLKKISWKASAKADKLIVRQSSIHEPTAVLIALDDALPLNPKAFEKAVSYAASATDRFIREGFAVGLVCSGTKIPPGSGEGHLHKILRELALIEETGAGEFPFDADIKGRRVLILKSRVSSLGRLAPFSDMVVYAEEL